MSLKLFFIVFFFNFASRLPQGLEDVSTYPALFAELIRRGWSDADLEKLAGRNLIRVFQKVEKVRFDFSGITFVVNKYLLPQK